MSSIRLPSSFAGKVGLFSAAGSILYVGYVIIKHQTLSRQVIHGTTDGALPKEIGRFSEDETASSDYVVGNYDIYHDYSFRQVPDYTITKASEEHFTLLLRRNMKTFSSSVQAWYFKYSLPNLRYTFSASHIDSLAFQEGDLVCGVYQVRKRSPHSASITMVPPPQMGEIKGFLDIMLEPGEDGAVLANQTFQLVPKGKIAPLKHAIPRFLHELASWSLLVSGGKYLQKLPG